MDDSGNAPAGSRRTWKSFAAAITAVLLFQCWHLYGLHVSKDLPLWDESAYLGWGDEFLQDGKVGSITNAPLYHILYALVITATGLLQSFWAMQYGLKLALTLLVVLLARRWSESPAFALLIGGFFAYSYFHLNCEVLVYYAALVPYLAAILVARRSPALSLGLSFMAGLGRLEYMAVPCLHAVWLVATHRGATAKPPRWRIGWRSLAVATPAVLVWFADIFVLTRITVWQLHNRLWFAWSQNYAFFRYLTGRDTGSNPWLDHQFIAERDFPGAHSLAEAVAVNPGGVFAHTWFNLWKLPGYLADFVIAHQNAGEAANLPLYVLGGLAAAAAAAAWRGRRAPRGAAPENAGLWRDAEWILIVGGIVTALPGVIVSSKTNYIMSLLPVALFGLARLHAAASRRRIYGRLAPPALVALALAFALFTVLRPPAYSAKGERGGIYHDAMTMREILGPLRGLRILGVSTASYVNYLGRANGHVFIEPLAISPVNKQADDFSLAALIRDRQPDVLLINSHWRSSRTYDAAVAGFDFSGWDAHPLRDGVLYTRKALFRPPEFSSGWYAGEAAGGRVWHWSKGDAAIALPNSRPGRTLVVRCALRAVDAREVRLTLDSRELYRAQLAANSRRNVVLTIGPLPAAGATLQFHTDRPAVRPAGGDTRELALCVEDFAVEWVLPKP